MKICSEGGCENKNHGKGLCRSCYYKKNKKHVLDCSKSWYEANKQRKTFISKVYYEANKERCLEVKSKWKTSHPERVKFYEFMYRQQEQKDMSECDKELSKKHIRSMIGTPCEYCGSKDSEIYHIDHRTPLSRGGTNHWFNLAKSCSTCNLRKGKLTAEEFLEREKESNL